MHKLLAGRRVLVVEDEMMVLMLMEDILSDLGCESITVAADVKQAIALINAQMFDAAMLDVNLNGDKSFPIADALATKNVPFVFATGYGLDALSSNYRDRPLLAKPYSRKDVEEILTELLADLALRPSHPSF